MLQKPYLCNVFPTRRQAGGAATKGHGGQKCRCGGVHTLYGGKDKCDALHTFFLNIHIKPQARGQYLAPTIMANYRFLFVPGHTSDYTCAKDSKAMKAAKEYLNVMKTLHPNIKYVSVWKHIGSNRYNLIGKHEN